MPSTAEADLMKGLKSWDFCWPASRKLSKGEICCLKGLNTALPKIGPFEFSESLVVAAYYYWPKTGNYSCLTLFVYGYSAWFLALANPPGPPPACRPLKRAPMTSPGLFLRRICSLRRVRVFWERLLRSDLSVMHDVFVMLFGLIRRWGNFFIPNVLSLASWE